MHSLTINSDLLKFAVRIDELEVILCGKDLENESNKADIFDFLTIVALAIKTNIGKLGSLKSKSVTVSFGEVDAEGQPAPVSSDVLCWVSPLSITWSGWYWVKNNSGDRWITYVTPYSSAFDPNFGMGEDDRIQVAGPIPSPYN